MEERRPDRCEEEREERRQVGGEEAGGRRRRRGEKTSVLPPQPEQAPHRVCLSAAQPQALRSTGTRGERRSERRGGEEEKWRGEPEDGVLHLLSRALTGEVL